MSFEELLNNLNPEIIGSLKRAIELGKWPNGVVLTEEQRKLCVEAVVTWERGNLPPEAQVGYVPPKDSPCGDKDEAQTLQWISVTSD
ncbi:YeaC family protein [Microbulbifer thermotolerans]|uniref:PA-phosphatase n=1 Tax=Microbulbifer thermotolerans TaxID=252514 RepID=A0A143HJC8_MICTH|nr:DUF1315 family protein [Microbulbifer thermotolerans]AMX01611.1 PA-phosphatase [Microbulbifer thermotolerans]MCX2780215.1 YeaC family protein [Microbulbifer thermotolerans]MCX2783839.1 YeaC family protein [Microbulbifer thermotolerans]MCX2802641.1 YeaC family protein [Microbulbifer thermotolerans]MCX2805831.1 YeaC family protein [Microbulbifer thermotolerans]